MNEDHHDGLDHHSNQNTFIEHDTTMPMLVTGQSEVNDSTSFRKSAEDMDELMIWEAELDSVAQSSNSEDISEEIHYLVLDTNVLINHLNLVRTVHALLADLPSSSSHGKGHGRAVLLIPNIVIRELDGLKNSDRKDSDGLPIKNLARIAINWLLDSHRHQKTTGGGTGTKAIRCQSLKERYDQSVKDQEADDQILDCCLYFAQSNNANANNNVNISGKVVLWSDDKNLGLKAESENISTLGGNLTLSSVFTSIGVDFPPELWSRIQKLSIHPTLEHTPNSTTSGSELVDEIAMDLDIDYSHDYNDDPVIHQETLDYSLFFPTEESMQRSKTTGEKRYPYLLPEAASLSPLPTPDTLSSFSTSSPIRNSPSPSSTPFRSTLSSHTSPESTLPPDELIVLICQALKSPMTMLLQHNQSSLHIDLIDIHKIPSTMIKQLTKIDSHLSQDLGQSTSSKERQVIFRAISQVRMIDDWMRCSQDPYVVKRGRLRKPRVGEVGDALDALVEELYTMGVLCDGVGEKKIFRDLARNVRELR